jgi:hypothetical protein
LAPREGPLSARRRGARLGIRQGCIKSLQHTFQLVVYLLIPKPQHSITLLVEISLSQPILALLLRLGMLTAVEFNNQVLRDAAENLRSRDQSGGAGEFESATALGSEVRSQLPLFVRRGTKTPASIAQIFIFRTDKSRASEGALTKDPLSAPKKQGAVLPLSGEENSSQIVQTRVPAWKGLSHAANVHWHAARSRAERIDWSMFADRGWVSLVIGKGSELSGQMY